MAWDVQAETMIGLGMLGNQFGFLITGTAGLPVVVQANTDLSQPNWTVVAIYSLTGDPIWKPGRSDIRSELVSGTRFPFVSEN